MIFPATGDFLQAQGRAPELTNSLLSSTRWGREDQSLGMYLAFDKDGGYTKSQEAPGGRQCNGRYQLKEGLLVLLPAAQDDQAVPRCPRVKCRLRISRTSLYRKYRLACKGDRSYWSLKHPVGAGQKRTVRRLKVITTGPRTAVLKTPATVRWSPRPKSKPYACRRANGRRFRGFPRGYDFTVVARTEKKVIERYVWKRIRKRRRRKRRRVRVPVKYFWYYVHINPAPRASCPRREGWISGRYLKFK